MINSSLSQKTWLDIKEKIEFSIINGTYRSAKKIPSISKIAEFYNCGLSTSQKVLDILCDENILTKQKGIGYFVKPFAQEFLFEKYKNILNNDILLLIKKLSDLGFSKDEIERLFLDNLKTSHSE